MKPYFSKLLTEQERAGSRNLSTKWGKRLRYDPDSDYDDQPYRVKMCRRNRQHPTGDYNWKELTDVLNPLKGYLRKSVGRPWDDVYSELCQNLDRRSVSGLHVFTHLWQYVDTDCWIGAETGKVYTDGKRGTDTPDDFYVHPWTGLLCAAEPRESWRTRFRREKANEVKEEIKISDQESHKLIDGIWYYTKYHEEDRADYSAWRKEHGLNPWKTGTKIIQEFKRQLSNKELRDLGLRNQPR